MSKTYLEHIAAKVANADAHGKSGVLNLRQAIYITPDGRRPDGWHTSPDRVGDPLMTTTTITRFETLSYPQILGAALKCNIDNGHHLPLGQVKRLAQRLHDMQTGVLDPSDPKVFGAALRQSDQTAQLAIRKAARQAAAARRVARSAAVGPDR